MSERVGQLREEIKGLAGQRVATDAQLTIAQGELNQLQGLKKLGLVPTPRLTALDREIARNEGTVGELSAKISQSQGKIAETEF